MLLDSRWRDIPARMFEQFRKKSSSLAVYLILGGLSFVFAINFGPGSGSCSPGPDTFAARVDGEVIRQQDFAVMYRQRVEQMRRIYGGSGLELSDDMLQKMGLRRQVLDGMIDRKILAAEARSRGIAVSDDELSQFLIKNFGLEKITAQEWENYVNNVYRMAAWQFEEDVREQLMGQKLVEILENNVEVASTELRSEYDKEFNRAMISYVRFDLSATAITEPSADEVTAWLGANTEAAQKAYEADLGSYKIGKQVEALQILKRVPPGAEPAVADEAKAALEAIKARIEAGEDFATVAAEVSEDGNQGKLGTFGRGTLARTLEDAAFSLKTGEMSEALVNSRQGWHLVKVVNVIEPSTKSFDEVKVDVARKVLVDERRDAAASSAAQAFLAKAKTDGGMLALTKTKAELEAEPQEGMLARETTPWIQKATTSVSGIGTSEELRGVIFSLTEANPLPEKAVRVGQSYFVVEYLNREEPSDEGFAERKETLRDQALSSKRQRVVQDWLKSARDAAAVEVNPMILASGN